MISANLRIAMFVAIVIYYVIIVALIKKKSLSLKYSIMWLAAGIVMLAMAMFPGILAWITEVLGITLPVNALFALMFFCVIIILVALTSIVSKQNEKIKTLVQNQAMLEHRIRELEKK